MCVVGGCAEDGLPLSRVNDGLVLGGNSCSRFAGPVAFYLGSGGRGREGGGPGQGGSCEGRWWAGMMAIDVCCCLEMRVEQRYLRDI
jgi:hypothetical protein